MVYSDSEFQLAELMVEMMNYKKRTQKTQKT